jgi:hypothetical protein
MIVQVFRNSFEPYKPDEFLVNGLLDTLIGLFIIILPNEMVNLFRVLVTFLTSLIGFNLGVNGSVYIDISIELQILLTIIGTLTAIIGITNLMKIRSKDIEFNFKLNIFLIIVRIVDFILGIYIFTILPQLSEILLISETVIHFFWILGMIATITDVIITILKNTKFYKILNGKAFYIKNK